MHGSVMCMAARAGDGRTILVCESVRDRPGGQRKPCAKKCCFSALLNLDATPGSPLTAQRVSRFERRRDRIRSKSRLRAAARCRPGDGERAIFGNRRCPRVLPRRRRFYCKRLFFGALTSEAVRQLSSFFG